MNVDLQNFIMACKSRHFKAIYSYDIYKYITTKWKKEQEEKNITY